MTSKSSAPRLAGAVSGRIAARLVAAAAQAATLIVIARILGPRDFGAMAVVMSVGYFLAALTGFGTTTRVLRIQSEEEHRKRELLGSYASVRAISIILTTAACLLMSAWLDALPVLIAVCWLTLDNVAEYAQAALAGLGRQLDSSLLILCQRLVPLVAVLASAMISSIVPFLISLAVTAAVATSQVLRHACLANPRPGVRGSFGYLASGLGSNLGQLELPVLRTVTQPIEFGSYALAARTANPLTIIGSAHACLLNI